MPSKTVSIPCITLHVVMHACCLSVVIDVVRRLRVPSYAHFEEHCTRTSETTAGAYGSRLRLQTATFMTSVIVCKRKSVLFQLLLTQASIMVTNRSLCCGYMVGSLATSKPVIIMRNSSPPTLVMQIAVIGSMVAKKDRSRPKAPSTWPYRR